jgi:type IV pilus assembly protein PilF
MPGCEIYSGWKPILKGISRGYSTLSIRKFNLVLVLILLPTLLLCCAGTPVGTTGQDTNVRALRDMGTSLVRRGNLRAGLEYLLKAVKEDSRNPDLNHELALVYRDLKEYQLSLDYFKKALHLRPDFPEAQNNLGTLYLLMEEWDKAIESFQTAIGNILYKTPEIAYNNMGLAYYHKGDYKKAIESYQMALAAFPGYSACYSNLGLVYEKLNRYEEAIQAYKSAATYRPEDSNPYLRLGSLYHRLGRTNDAVEVLKEFLSIVKEGTEAEEAQDLLEKIENP